MIKLKQVQFIHPIRVGRGGGSHGFIDIESKKHKGCKLLALLPDKECVVVIMDGDCKLIPMHVNIKQMTPLEVPSVDEMFAVDRRKSLEELAGVPSENPAADPKPKKKPGPKPKGKGKGKGK